MTSSLCRNNDNNNLMHKTNGGSMNQQEALLFLTLTMIKRNLQKKNYVADFFSAGIKNKKDHHDRHAEDMRQKTWQQPQYVSYAASSSSVAPGDTTTTTFSGNSAGTTTQQLLTPFRCPYECKYCPKHCGTSKPGHGGHSCYEHRHRRD